MRDRELYATILGLRAPWRVVDVDLDANAELVSVHVGAETGSRFACPECSSLSPIHDHRTRKWRHLDTCQFQTLLIADVPRVKCHRHGVHQVRVPWAEPGSSFTALFEAVVIDWLKEASVLAVARRMGLTWDAVAGIQERAVRRGLRRRELDVVEFLGVDETSFRKRHDYVTVVTDLISGKVLFVTDDRRQSSLDRAFRHMTPHQLEGVQAVAMDMHKPYIASTREHVPDADRKICFDRFHVAQHIGNAVDQVRRQEHRDLLKQGDRSLTGTKFLWLQREEDLNASRRVALEILKDGKLRTARAWAMKQFAATLWGFMDPTWAREAWGRLVSWLRRSRLEPMKRVGATIRNHLWGIINAVTQGVTNAGSESVNARIQRVKKMACGFRNKERFRNAILFHIGGLDMYPAVVPHTDS